MLLDQLLSFYLLSIAGDQTQGFTNIRLIPYQKEELPLPVLLFCHFTEKKKCDFQHVTLSLPLLSY